ncbi:MAG: isocitrate/isopropylmalate family dehydrogenase [Saprospiraceae bacterium]
MESARNYGGHIIHFTCCWCTHCTENSNREKIYQAGRGRNYTGCTANHSQKQSFSKAPITITLRRSGGYKSLNVSARKFLGLYADIRPNISYHPFVDTKHPNMDVVIIRENEEDLYAGIEHQQTDEVVQCRPTD